MNLTSPKEIKELLKKYNAAALKQLGQHFLVDKGVLRKIIEAAGLNPKDTVLEIGPGIGVLTQALAQKAGKVIAIEKDQKMCEILRETLKDFKNVEVVRNDILKIENSKLIKNWELKIGNYKVVANLPYYITSPVIRKFLEADNPPKEMVLMVQKEVAQRICAKPPDMNLLAVSVQFYVHPVKSSEAGAKQFNGASPKIITYVSKKSFWPEPKVNSAIIKISKIKYQKSKTFSANFFKVVRAGFSQPRKQLINNLSNGLKKSKEEIKKWLLENKILPQQRAETLSIDDWISLTKTYPAPFLN